jgi:hypothetical protein
MSGERVALQLAVEVPRAAGLQRHGIQLVGPRALLEREQAATVPDQGGVRVAVVGLVGDARVIEERIAIRAEQGPPSGALQLPATSADVAAAQVGVPVPEADHGDHAVTVDVVIVRPTRRELVVGPDAVEGAVEVGRDLSLDLELEDVGLGANGGEEAIEMNRLREPRRQDRLLVRQRHVKPLLVKCRLTATEILVASAGD